MKTNLGKVAITPKGTWNSTTAYTALDTVNFGGGSWLAKRGNIAVTPTEGDDWMQLSAKGADAELTKDGIVSALGYTPEKFDAGWEKIESFTISDDETTEIVRTQEPDGTPYDFKGIWVFLKGKQNVSLLYLHLNGSAEYIGTMCPSTTNDYWCFAQYEIRGSLLDGGYLASSAYLGSKMSYRNSPAYLGTYCGGKTAVEKIRIYTGGTVAFTSGTQIHIYAVRAT